MIATGQLALPKPDGSLEAYTPGAPSPWPSKAQPARSRVAFAAAHVVVDPLARAEPWLEAAIDWEATLAYRRHLWDLGLSVAEAMDTAQRGMGLDWPASRELIRRALTEARAVEAAERIASGAGTDHLASEQRATLDQIIEAYLEQS